MTSAEHPDAPEKFEKHFEVIDQGSITAIELLSNYSNLSRHKIKQLMHKGAVWLTHGNNTSRIRRATRKLPVGSILHLYYDEYVLAQMPPKAHLICDEGDYSVWFKPAGMLSQGSKYGDHTSIYRWAETHLQPQRNAFLVHRLDRSTQGLILLAHSKKAAATLAKMFRERKIKKYYQAIVKGYPEPQTIDTDIDGRQAISRILSVTETEQATYTLLDIQILTGRKHQIRRHLSEIGFPVLGDRLHGQAPDNGQLPRLYLSASKIMFTSPFDGQEKNYQLNQPLYPEFATADPDFQRQTELN